MVGSGGNGGKSFPTAFPILLTLFSYALNQSMSSHLTTVRRKARHDVLTSKFLWNATRCLQADSPSKPSEVLPVAMNANDNAFIRCVLNTDALKTIAGGSCSAVRDTSLLSIGGVSLAVLILVMNYVITCSVIATRKEFI